MGFGATLNKAAGDILQVVRRPAQVYPVGVDNLFTIIGGPVYIHGLLFYANTAIDNAGAGTTMEVQICGVPADSAVPTAIATAIGCVCIWPLNNTVPVPNLAMNIMPTAAGVFSVVAAPGSAGGDIITVQVATASTVGTCSWYVLYERIDTNAHIIVSP